MPPDCSVSSATSHQDGWPTDWHAQPTGMAASRLQAGHVQNEASRNSPPAARPSLALLGRFQTIARAAAYQKEVMKDKVSSWCLYHSFPFIQTPCRSR